MNKFIIVLSWAAILFTGCNSDEAKSDPTEPTYKDEITGLETHIILPRNDGVSYRLIFETSGNWTISEYRPSMTGSYTRLDATGAHKMEGALYSWCEISPMNGGDGASEVMVRLDENSGPTRRAKFVLSAGRQKAIFTVEQTDCDKSDMPEYDDSYENSPDDNKNDNNNNNEDEDNKNDDNNNNNEDDNKDDTPGNDSNNPPVKEHITFTDSEFGMLVLRHYDTDGDGGISSDEIEHVEELVPEFATVAATSLDDVAKFKSLRVFRYEGTTAETLNLSANRLLVRVQISGCGIRRLDLSGCVDLAAIYCNGATALEELLLPDNVRTLSDLQLSNVALTSLKVTNAPLLTELAYIKTVKTLNNISLRGLKSMQELDLAGMSLERVEVSGMESLQRLTLSKNSSLESIDIAATPALTHLLFAGCNVTAIDLSAVSSLEEVVCSYNPLRSLDVSTNKALKSVSAYGVSQMNGRDKFTIWKSYDAVSDPVISADGNCELRGK